MPSFICIYSWVSLVVKEYYGTPCRSLRCWCKDAPETNMTERRWMTCLGRKNVRRAFTNTYNQSSKDWASDEHKNVLCQSDPEIAFFRQNFYCVEF